MTIEYIFSSYLKNHIPKLYSKFSIAYRDKVKFQNLERDDLIFLHSVLDTFLSESWINLGTKELQGLQIFLGELGLFLGIETDRDLRTRYWYVVADNANFKISTCFTTSSNRHFSIEDARNHLIENGATNPIIIFFKELSKEDWEALTHNKNDTKRKSL